jgi:hypothetical protein
MMRSPPDGYHAVTLQQALQADRALFVAMAEMTREGINLDASGNKPLEQAIIRARVDPQVNMLLQPLPASSKRTFSQMDEPVRNVPGQPGFGKKKLRKEAAAQRRSQQSRGSDYKGDKGKGRGKSSGKASRMPNALKGMAEKTPSGDTICFAFNLSTCKNGSSCRHQHVCCKPGCFQPHSLQNHS